jgi:3-oxoacyl-[acyl-carrier-protein] synthase II
MLAGGPRKISPFFIPGSIINLAAGHVSIRYGARGPNEATATACTSSAHSIGDAFRIIERGDADAMIAGGAEAAITPMGVGGFAAMKALSTRNDDPTHACRPFDKDRDGFVVRRRRGHPHPGRARVRPGAAQTSSPRSSATACPPTPST